MRNLEREKNILVIAALPKNHITYDVGDRRMLVCNQLQHIIVHRYYLKYKANVFVNNSVPTSGHFVDVFYFIEVFYHQSRLFFFFRFPFFQY